MKVLKLTLDCLVTCLTAQVLTYHRTVFAASLLTPGPLFYGFVLPFCSTVLFYGVVTSVSLVEGIHSR